MRKDGEKGFRKVLTCLVVFCQKLALGTLEVGRSLTWSSFSQDSLGLLSGPSLPRMMPLLCLWETKFCSIQTLIAGVALLSQLVPLITTWETFSSAPSPVCSTSTLWGKNPHILLCSTVSATIVTFPTQPFTLPNKSDLSFLQLTSGASLWYSSAAGNAYQEKERAAPLWWWLEKGTGTQTWKQLLWKQCRSIFLCNGMHRNG